MNNQKNRALSPTESLAELKSHYRTLDGLRAAQSLMYWDQATHLPERGAKMRGEHLSQLARVSHQLETDPKIEAWLSCLENHGGSLDAESIDRDFVRVVRQDYDRSVKVPEKLVSEMSALASQSYELWKKARGENNFVLVVEVLKRTIDLRKQFAEHIKKPNHKAPMDPLIDLEDPGFTTAQILPLFGDLRSHLVPLLKKLNEAGSFDRSCLMQAITPAQQLKFGETVIRKLGYDFNRGRQDLTHHPFMVRIAGGDVRITTRCKENDFSECLFSTIHEAGHAMYELGIDESLDGTPLGQGASSGVHESQSRLWENMVARGLPFWEHFYPILKAEIPGVFDHVPLKVFHRAINRTERGLISTDADEVSYNLHVMIRFDLEAELFAGTLDVKSLPDAWNERYRQDLGINPSHLSEGVLQDVHWFHGGLGGTFQSYTIGNILSAQLFAAAQKQIPNLDHHFRLGEFSPLRDWLRINLHQYGRRLEIPDLIVRSTGQPLAMDDYVSYLEGKYLQLLNQE